MAVQRMGTVSRVAGFAACLGLVLASGAIADEGQPNAGERQQKARAAKAAGLGFVLDPDVAPKVEHVERPRYPKKMLAQRLGGQVVVVFGITAKGAVVAPEVLESAPGFDAAALKAIAKWRFTPARKAGAAVGTVEVAPVIFKVH